MNTPQRPASLIASLYGYAGAAAFWLTAAIATLFAIPQYSRHYADLRQDADAGSLVTLLLLLIAGLAVLGVAVSALLTWLDSHGWSAARWLTWFYSGLSALCAIILLITNPFSAVAWHRWIMTATAMLTLLLLPASGVLLGHRASAQFFLDYLLARKQADAQRRAARLHQLAQVPSHLSGAPVYPNTYPHQPAPPTHTPDPTATATPPTSPRLATAPPQPLTTSPPVPSPHPMVTCPICGSSQLLTEPRESRAERRLDAESILAVDFTVTQIRCSACGLLVNDDVNGTTAVAYGKLATEVGAPQPQISAKVQDAMQHAGLLPALSDTERQQDYDQVRQSWQCLGLRRVPADELQDALTRIIRGYFAEGADELKVETLEQHVMQLSFLNVAQLSFHPIRLSRTSDGDFSFYGPVPLYRLLACSLTS